MRDEVLMSVIDRAVGDDDFRQRAQRDPEATLRDEGYDLTDDEMAAVKEFQSEVLGLSDDELQARLTRRQAG